MMASEPHRDRILAVLDVCRCFLDLCGDTKTEDADVVKAHMSTMEGGNCRVPESLAREILELVVRGYEAQVQHLASRVKYLGTKKKDEQVISEKKVEIDTAKINISLKAMSDMRDGNTFSRLLESHEIDINKVTTKFRGGISSASSIAAVSTSMIEYREEIAKLAARRKSDVETEVKTMIDMYQLRHDIIIPRLNVARVKKATRSRAYITVKVKKKKWLGLRTYYTERKEYSKTEHLRLYKSAARSSVKDEVAEVDRLVRVFIGHVKSDLQATLQTQIDAAEQRLQQVNEEVEANNEILAELEEAKRKCQVISTERDRVREWLVNFPMIPSMNRRSAEGGKC